MARATPDYHAANDRGISYLHKGLQPFKIAVFLDGKRIGVIKREPIPQHGMRTTLFNYFYQPKNSKARGANFSSVEAVKASLESK